MNTQEIIVYILVLASVVYTVYNIAKLFQPKKDDSACSCGSCEFKTKIEEIKSLTGK